MNRLNKLFWTHHLASYDLSKLAHINALMAVLDHTLSETELVDVFLNVPSSKENGLHLLFQKIYPHTTTSHEAAMDDLVNTVYQKSMMRLYSKKHLSLEDMLWYLITSPASDAQKVKLLKDIWLAIDKEDTEQTEDKDFFLCFLTQVNLTEKYYGKADRGFIRIDNRCYRISTYFIIELLKQLPQFKEFVLPSRPNIGLSRFETRIAPFFAIDVRRDKETQQLLSALSFEELNQLVLTGSLHALFTRHTMHTTKEMIYYKERIDYNEIKTHAINMAQHIVENVIVPFVTQDRTTLTSLLETYQDAPIILGFMASRLPQHRLVIFEYMAKSDFNEFFKNTPTHEEGILLAAFWREHVLPSALTMPELLAQFMLQFVVKRYAQSKQYVPLLTDPDFRAYLTSFLINTENERRYFKNHDHFEEALYDLLKKVYAAHYEWPALVDSLVLGRLLPQKLKTSLSCEDLVQYLKNLHPLIEHDPRKIEQVLRQITAYLDNPDRSSYRAPSLSWFLLAYAYHVPAAHVSSLHDFKYLLQLRALRSCNDGYNDTDFSLDAAFIELYPHCEQTLAGLINRTPVQKSTYINEQPITSRWGSFFEQLGFHATKVEKRVQKYRKTLTSEQLHECANGYPDPFIHRGTIPLSRIAQSTINVLESECCANEKETKMTIPTVHQARKVVYPQHVEGPIPLSVPEQANSNNLPMAAAVFATSEYFFPAVPTDDIKVVVPEKERVLAL